MTRPNALAMGDRVHILVRGVTAELSPEDAGALARELDAAVLAVWSARFPVGTRLRGAPPCWGKLCGRTERVIVGYGVTTAGFVDVVCARCAARSVMRPADALALMGAP